MFGFFSFLWWIPFLFFFFLIPVTLFAWPHHGHNHISDDDDGSVMDDPLEVLRMRFAKGEITEDQFKKMRETLTKDH